MSGLAVAGSTTGAVVGGITIVAIHSSPARGADATRAGDPALADSFLTGGAGLVAAGTVVGGIAVVAVYSTPASVADAARSGNPTVAYSFVAGALLVAAGAVVGGITVVAVLTTPAKVAGGAVPTTAVIAGPALASAETRIRDTKGEVTLGVHCH